MLNFRGIYRSVRNPYITIKAIGTFNGYLCGIRLVTELTGYASYHLNTAICRVIPTMVVSKAIAEMLINSFIP